MSFGGSKKKTTTTSQNTNSTTNSSSTGTQGAEQWMQDEGERIYGQARDTVGDGQYKAYTGERVADYDQNFTDAQNMVRDLAGNSQNLGKATSILDQIKASLDPNATVQSLMNPYVDATLDPTIRKINAAGATNRAALNREAALAGATGSTNLGVAQALADRDVSQQIGDATNTAYSGAYDRAMTQKNTIMSQLMQLPSLYTGVDNAATARTTNIAKMLTDFSDKSKAVAQAKDNAGYSQYLDQRDWTKNQMSWLNQLLNAVPHDTVSSQTGTSNTTAQQAGTSVSKEPDNSGFGLLGQLGGTILGGLMTGGTGLGLGGLSSLFGGSSASTWMPDADASLGKGSLSDWS